MVIKPPISSEKIPTKKDAIIQKALGTLPAKKGSISAKISPSTTSYPLSIGSLVHFILHLAVHGHDPSLEQGQVFRRAIPGLAGSSKPLAVVEVLHLMTPLKKGNKKIYQLTDAGREAYGALTRAGGEVSMQTMQDFREFFIQQKCYRKRVTVQVEVSFERWRFHLNRTW